MVMLITISMFYIIFQQLWICESRSVSIVASHQQFFSAEADDDIGYIQLSGFHEERLQLRKPAKPLHNTLVKETEESGSPEDSDFYNRENGISDDNGASRSVSDNDSKQSFNIAKTDAENVISNEHVTEYDHNTEKQHMQHEAEYDVSREQNSAEKQTADNDISSDNSQQLEDHYYDNDDIDDDEDIIDELNDASLQSYPNTVALQTYPNTAALQTGNIDSDIDNVESAYGLKRLLRRKRAADEQWKTSLPGGKPKQTTEDADSNIWNEVTDEDLKKAKLNTYTEVAKYVGMTALSVLVFVTIGICFLRDPVGCIFAFGTGCPCCLLCCPCVRAFTDKYLNMKRIVREQMNKYMPGVIVNDDGTLDFYDPTPDELDLLLEIIDELQ